METISSFNGLTNVSDSLRLGMRWLVQAENINITDTGSIAKREGYALNRSGVFKSAFSTFDFARCYVATSSAIQTFGGLVLASLTSDAPLYWCEINNQVFYNNGTDRGIILPDESVIQWAWTLPNAPALSAVTGNLPAGMYQVCCTSTLPDGRETGATEAVTITLTEGQALQISGLTQGCNVYVAPANSEVFQLLGTATQTAMTFNSTADDLGRDLLNSFLDPLPLGADVIQAWRGRIYAAHYSQADNQTAIWFSEPLGFHLFKLNFNFILVPGRVLMLAPHDEALLIGTEQRVFAYSGDKLMQIADYGVVPGQHWDKSGSDLLFWSTRGLCSALPFSNLTEKNVSIAPGVRAGGCFVRTGGQRRYLACLQQGGAAFNPYP